MGPKVAFLTSSRVMATVLLHRSPSSSKAQATYEQALYIMEGSLRFRPGFKGRIGMFFVYFLKFFKIFFYIVEKKLIKCCVSFRYTAKIFSVIYTALCVIFSKLFSILYYRM